MNISHEIINTTEDKIKSYYRQQAEMERFNHRLDLLYRHKEDIQKDIDESNISLDYSLRGINYDKDRVQTSVLSSVQEDAIEKAFLRLEKQLENMDIEILDVKLSIRELERKISDTEFIINKLNDDARDFIRLRYKEHKSLRQISIRLNASEATIWRLREAVLYDISKWICAYF